MPNGDLYAFTTRLYRSVDEASTWMRVNSPPANVWSLAGGPDGALYALRNGVPYVSTDSATTWTPMLNAPPGARCLIFASNDRVFAGTVAGLHRSDDGGATWQQTSVTGIVNTVLEVGAGHFYTGATGDLLESTDGDVWTPVATMPNTITVLAKRSAGGIWVGLDAAESGGPNGGLWYFDGGAPQSANFTGGVTEIRPQPDGSVWLASWGACYGFVCGGGGVFHSANGSPPWLGAFGDYSINALIVDVLGAHAATWGEFTDIGMTPGGGVWSAASPPAAWAPKSPNLPHSAATQLAVIPGTVFALADRIVRWTTDRGATWQRATASPFYHEGALGLAVHPLGDVFVHGAWGSIRHSTDNGTTWSETFLDAADNLYHADIDVSAMGTVLVPKRGGGAFRSTDRGVAWTVGDAGATETFYVIEPSAGSRVFAASDSKLYISDDDGVSWSVVANAGADELGANADGSILYVAPSARRYVEGPPGTWTQQLLPVLNYVRDIEVDAGGTVYANTEYSGVLRWRDNEPGWTDTGLPESCTPFVMGSDNPLAIDSNGYLYAGTTCAGVYRSKAPLTAPTDTGDALNTLAAVRLVRNPNRGFAEFRLQLAERSPVTLHVHDVRGRLIDVVRRGAELGPGSHTLRWDPARSHPAGIYLYRCTIGAQSRSGKLLLVR
jgi:photosystem II stability/assembly factor-like uncharacterized protein